MKKVVHRGYSATERQLGTIYSGWVIVKRRKIPRWLRWFYDGKHWEFIGWRRDLIDTSETNLTCFDCITLALALGAVALLLLLDGMGYF